MDISSLIINMFVGILSGLFVLLFGKKLIAFFRNSRSRIIRKWYISAHIGVFNGKADTSITHLVGKLFFIFPITLLIFSTLYSQTINSELLQLENMQNKLENIQKVDNLTTKESLSNDIAKLKNDFNYYKEFSRYLSIFSWLWFYSLILFWYPFMKYRALIVFEYKRFRDTLTVVLDKEELVNLLNEEVQVIDEETLKRYVSTLINYSEKYHINGVKNRLWIWN